MHTEKNNKILYYMVYCTRKHTYVLDTLQKPKGLLAYSQSVDEY